MLATEANYQPPTGLPSVSAAAIAAPGGQPVLVAGTLVNLSVANLTTNGVVATGTPYARNFGNVFIAVNGVRAPIVALSATQATIQIPWDIALGTASIVAVAGGQPGNSLSVPVLEVAPGILTVTHANGTAVSASQPANVGEPLVLWALGPRRYHGPLLRSRRARNTWHVVPHRECAHSNRWRQPGSCHVFGARARSGRPLSRQTLRSLRYPVGLNSRSRYLSK